MPPKKKDVPMPADASAAIYHDNAGTPRGTELTEGAANLPAVAAQIKADYEAQQAAESHAPPVVDDEATADTAGGVTDGQ